MHKFTWTGQGTTDDWKDAGNWSPGGPPGKHDLAIFAGQGSKVSGLATVGAVQLLTAQTVAFAGRVTTLGLSGMATSFAVGGNAEVSFTAGARLSTAGKLVVGVSGGRSALDMQGAALTTQATVIGVDAASEGLVTFDSAIWAGSGNLVVGLAGDGSLSVGGGATVNVGMPLAHEMANFEVGEMQGATGVLDISGGSSVIVSRNILIGGAEGAKAGTHGTGQVTIGPGSNLDSQLGAIDVAGGSFIALSEGNIAGPTIDIAKGALVVGSGDISSTYNVQNDGEIRASGTLFLSTNVMGKGELSIGAGSTLVLLGPVSSQSAIQFLGGTGTLNLENFPVTSAPIEGFKPGDIIEALGVERISFDQPSGELTLYGTKEVGDRMLVLGGNYAGDSFSLQQNGDLGIVTVTGGHG